MIMHSSDNVTESKYITALEHRIAGINYINALLLIFKKPEPSLI